MAAVGAGRTTRPDSHADNVGLIGAVSAFAALVALGCERLHNLAMRLDQVLGEAANSKVRIREGILRLLDGKWLTRWGEDVVVRHDVSLRSCGGALGWESVEAIR
jgi:hypothetical protein